ncbi:TadE family protein [Candidatus Burkholderia verschuerenii]|uniref:TadE family protein n=1 Tax=Candidatus Burkholderia verschuerenii TaxID=242163 RepID=UPI00067C7DFB|nr:TadE family protein [Candidatus Burkholderia verschuerenii]
MSAIRSSAWRSRRKSGGFVSLEVVIITPLLALILLGFAELYMYMRAVSTVEHMAFVLADSLGQRNQVYDTNATTDPDDLGSIWNAAWLLSSPLALQTNGGVIISSICDTNSSCTPPSFTTATASGTPYLVWTRKSSTNISTTLTAKALLPSTWPFRAGDSAIVVEVFYSYKPLIWAMAPMTTMIYKRVVVYPRTGKSLPLKTAS